MKLIFQDNDCGEKLIAESNDREELYMVMMDYIDEKLNFKSYYTRCWLIPEQNREVIDYGSHTKFFIIEH